MANENVIPAGLPGYVMRKRIEDKATLHKGGMYVGTGEYETITDKKGNEYKVYKTEELPVGKEGQVLMSTVDGIKWEDQENINFHVPMASYSKKTETCDLSISNSNLLFINELLNQLRKDYKNFIYNNIIYFSVYDLQNQQFYNFGFMFIPFDYVDMTHAPISKYQISSSIIKNKFITIDAKRQAGEYNPETSSNTWYYTFTFSLCTLTSETLNPITYITLLDTYRKGKTTEWYSLISTERDQTLFHTMSSDLKNNKANFLYYEPGDSTQKTITNASYISDYNSDIFKIIDSLSSQSFVKTDNSDWGILLKGDDGPAGPGSIEIYGVVETNYLVYWKQIL